jgi:hypothetical protein
MRRMICRSIMSSWRCVACFFHARKLVEAFGGGLHGDLLPYQATKLDGPE